MEGRAHVLKQRLLGGGQVKIVGHLAVAALAGTAAQRDNGHVGSLGLGLQERRSGHHFGNYRRGVEQAPGFGQLRLLIFQELRVGLAQRRGHREAGRAQPLGNGNGVGPVHVAAAGAARNQVVAGVAEQGQLLARPQGQGLGFVAQQHHAFGGGLAGHGGIGFQGRLAGVPITLEGGRLQHQLQHAQHVGIELGEGELTAFQGGGQLLGLGRGTGHQQVVAGLQLGHGVAAAVPVGHHQALETPFLAQQRGQQIVAFGGVRAVHEVVARHHRPGLRLLHRELKPLQVDFAQGPLAHRRVQLHAVEFLVVHGEVLDAGAHALAFYPVHEGGGHVAGHQRVFGIVLEVAPTQRVAVDVHARGQQHVDAKGPHLAPKCRAHPPHQGRIPAAGQQRGHRKRRGVVGFGAVAAARGGNAHASRPIRKRERGDAQPGNGMGAARRAGHLLGHFAVVGVAGRQQAFGEAGRVETHAHHQPDFLVGREGGQHFLERGLAQLRGRPA